MSLFSRGRRGRRRVYIGNQRWRHYSVAVIATVNLTRIDTLYRDAVAFDGRKPDIVAFKDNTAFSLLDK